MRKLIVNYRSTGNKICIQVFEPDLHVGDICLYHHTPTYDYAAHSYYCSNVSNVIDN